MTQTSPSELFRQAAETENGMPISAGARVAHVRVAVESGRAFYVDLSGVAVDKRPALIAEIKELVHRASATAPLQHTDRALDTSNAPA